MIRSAIGVIVMLMSSASIASDYGSDDMQDGIDGLEYYYSGQKPSPQDYLYDQAYKDQEMLDRWDTQQYQQEQLRLLREQNELLRQKR